MIFAKYQSNVRRSLTGINCDKKLLFYSKIQIQIFFLILIIAQRQCKDGNKTYHIGETYVTMDCKERCVCNFINGTAETKCSSLCTAPVDSLCKANTQQIEVYEQSLGGTNCSCQGKRCIPGLKLFRNKHPHMPLNRFFNTFKIE